MQGRRLPKGGRILRALHLSSRSGVNYRSSPREQHKIDLRTGDRSLKHPIAIKTPFPPHEPASLPCCKMPEMASRVSPSPS